MGNVKEALVRLEAVDGYVGSAVGDSESGMALGTHGGQGILNMEVAAAANAEVVRAKRKAVKALALKDEIEDMLITLGKQYHIIRPLRTARGAFIYLALERSRANLALARHAVAEVEKELVL